MRRPLFGLVVALGVSAIATEARAQFGGGLSDPFFAYYSFYLPRQQAQAMQPGPEATINAITANRQQYAATNRNGMFDPNNGGFGSGDFGDEFSSNGVLRRRNNSGGAASRHGGNLNGLGPTGYYNSANKFYPSIRAGRGKNANLATIRSRGFSGGGMAGMSMGGGLPGPR